MKIKARFSTGNGKAMVKNLVDKYLILPELCNRTLFQIQAVLSSIHFLLIQWLKYTALSIIYKLFKHICRNIAGIEAIHSFYACTLDLK